MAARLIKNPSSIENKLLRIYVYCDAVISGTTRTSTTFAVVTVTTIVIVKIKIKVARTDSRTSRRTAHPLLVARAVVTVGGDKGSIDHTVGVHEGRRRLLGHHALLVLVQHLPGKTFDEL